MKRKHLSLAIGCVLAAPLAWAQDATPVDGGQKTRTLETVTITARKREETLQEVPVAVTAFTQDALDRLNVEDLGDLDAQVPNLTVYAARGSSSTLTAYIRGVGQSDPLWGVDPGVGIYMDDVYVARPQGALLDVFDVERVEVLRGPQGTLYGKNTIGGAIKYISKALTPGFDGFGSVTIGNYGQRDLKAAVGGGLGGNDALRARIAVADLHRDGFGRNRVTGEDVSDKDITAFRLNVGAWVSDDFNLQFALDHMDDTSGVRGAKMLNTNRFADTTNICVPVPAFGILSCPPPTPRPGNTGLDSRYDVRNGMPNINDTEMLGVSAAANYRMNEDWSFKYVWAKRESDTETNIDFDTLPDKIADVKAFYRDEQVSNEIQANFDGGGRARGVMGLYFFDGQAGGQVLNTFLGGKQLPIPQPPAPPLIVVPLQQFGDTQGTVYTESVAAYADWSFSLSDKLELGVGARYTDEEKHAVVLNRCYSNATFTTLANCPNLTTSTASNFDKTISFQNLSPKVSLDYQLTPDVLLYGLASRGFKSGGYNIRANATAVPRSAEPFDDEQVDSYELGAKMGLFDQSLFLNLAYFHNKYDDIQLSIFTAYDSNRDGVDDAFFGDFTNAGAGTVQGFEAEYQWLATSNWTISGNLAWLDAKYDEYMFKGIDIAHQQEFTNAPEFSGAVNVEYRMDLGAGGSLSSRVGYAYQSDVVATTEVVFDPVLRTRTQPITQDGYGLVSAGVIWKPTDAWTVSLQGSNLADKEYRTTGYNLDAALGIITGFYGAPRQYSLSVRYDF